MKNYIALLLTFILTGSLAVAEGITQKDIKNVEVNIEKSLSGLSQADREKRAGEIAGMQAHLKGLKNAMDARDASQAAFEAIATRSSEAQKSAKSKNEDFEKAVNAYNRNRESLIEDSASYEKAKKQYNDNLRDWIIPAQQAQYDAEHREGKKLAARKQNIEVRIAENNQDQSRVLGMKNSVEAAYARISSLEDDLARAKQQQANLEMQVKNEGWTLVHVLNAFAAGKPYVPDASDVASQGNNLKDAPNDKQPPKSLSQTLADSTALRQLQGLEAGGAYAQTQPGIDTAGKLGPGLKTSPAIAPKTPETPISRQEALVHEYDKKSEELKSKLFDINNHPEKFKDVSEQSKAMKAVTDEQQTVNNKRQEALTVINTLKIESLKKPETKP